MFYNWHIFKNTNKFLKSVFDTQGRAEIFECQYGVQEIDQLFPPCKDKSNYYVLRCVYIGMRIPKSFFSQDVSYI